MMQANDKRLVKIMKYCAQAEHCTQDVMRKLISWEVPEEEAKEMLQWLRREKFLDDVRYARSFVAEKWNLQGWGKVKILHQLLEKEIEETMALGALNEIPEAEYQTMLERILHVKWMELRKSQDPASIRKVAAFGLSRGFEEERIEAWVSLHEGDI